MPTERELEDAYNNGFGDSTIVVYNNYYEHPELRDAYDQGWDDEWEMQCAQ